MTLANRFDEFIHAQYGKPKALLPKRQLLEAEDAFYAGATMLLLEIATDDQYRLIVQELHDFKTRVVQRYVDAGLHSPESKLR